MNLNEALAEIGTLKGKIKSVNDEAKGHRLKAEDAKDLADEWGAKVAEWDAMAQALTAAHAAELDQVKAEHAAKLADSERVSAETIASARRKMIMADLKDAAHEAGMLDLDCLALIDLEAVEADKDGNATNSADLVAALKESKPFLFVAPAPLTGRDTGTTASTARVPSSSTAHTKFDAMKASPEEYAARKATLIGRARRSSPQVLAVVRQL